jgi:hypothetical protein
MATHLSNNVARQNELRMAIDDIVGDIEGSK